MEELVRDLASGGVAVAFLQRSGVGFGAGSGLISGGRFLWTPANERGWGALRLTTVGRTSGRPRTVLVGYLDDGPDLVALAMNGWEEGHPAWWLNLQAHPDAVVVLDGQEPRPVRARAAAGEERERLWRRWQAVQPDLDRYAGRRSTGTPVVVLEPRQGQAANSRRIRDDLAVAPRRIGLDDHLG